MVRIVVKLDGAKRKLSTKSLQNGRMALGNQALADMNPFVPMDEGVARQTGHVVGNGEAIVWDTPYIKKLFYMPMRNYTTPGTGPRWDMKSQRIFISDWIKAFTKGADW